MKQPNNQYKCAYDELVFQAIDGFSNYSVSNTGIVINNKTKKQIKITKNEFGYSKVNLWKFNKYKTFKVHRLVAMAFIENNENKKTVNHKDGNKENNCIQNLEWSTHSENHRHAYKYLNRKAPHEGRFGNLHHRSKPVGLVINGKIVEKHESARQASLKKNLCESSVAKAARTGCKAGDDHWIYL